MKRFWMLLIMPFLLVGCEFIAGINTQYFPDQERGVTDGLALGQRKLKDLQEKGVILADSRQGTVVILPADVVFRETIDRVTINPDFQPALNELVFVLKGYPKVKISVVGHTDGVMTDDLEQKKSSEFAYAIANYLTAAGISPSQIRSVRGVGNDQPVDRGPGFRARQINRRVEVITDAPIK